MHKDIRTGIIKGISLLIVIGMMSGLSGCKKEEPVVQEKISSSEVSGEEEVISDILDGDEKETSDNSKKEETSKANPEEIICPDEISPLHVDGAYLYNENNEHVQLRGVSTHGLAWFPEYVNYETFRTLRDDWGVNLIRLAMYTEEYGGYCAGGDKEKLSKLVDSGVEYATELGMYVIIDWHILSDGNPNTHKDEAEKFFEEKSKKFAANDNVIYEICNEPNGTDWNSSIKPYAKDIISVIRANDPDSLIIVGTNTWCQDILDVVDSPIDEENILYSVHFYAASNGDDCRKRVKDAIDSSVPVIISECSICNSDGSQEVDYNSGDMWMKLINKHGISYVFWNLSNKDETSALLAPGCKKLQDFEESDLSVTGKYYLEYK